ncbi:hypothetical protein Ahy_A06g029045 [Arachis hypogaea]|uniref:Uncharacterized protein n=1 Tax=Arachis hypogaea TaxID=3818 RepID=A0A445CSD7_ARAHY|nr:hypothetical protein Ahy_A06g029045 [Arachis hypogaea]
MYSKWLGKQFKKKVESNLRIKIKELVKKAHKKWNLTVTKSMAAKTKQEPLSQIQGAFREQYKRINDYCAKLLKANPRSSIVLKYDDVMPPPYRRPSHRPVKKKKRGPGDENRSQTHLFRRGHKKGGCTKPKKSVQTLTQQAGKGPKTGWKVSCS